MESYDTDSLHPKIRKQIRLVRWLSVFSIVLLLATSAAVLLPFYTSEIPFPAWIVAALVIVDAGLILGFRFMLRKLFLQPLHRAARLMQQVPPKEMLLANAGVVEMNGMVAALYEPDVTPEDLAAAKGDLPPVALITLKGNRKRLPNFNKGVPVRIYARNDDSLRFLVVETEEFVLWGTLSTRESRARGWRTLRLTLSMMLVLIMGLLFTLGLILYQLWTDIAQERSLAMQSEEWPHAQATILESRIKEVMVSEGKTRKPGFEALVRYRYTVNGQSYESSHIHFCYKPGRRRDKAAAIVNDFPVNKTVRIVYHPASPKLALLYPGYAAACDAELDQLRKTFVLIAPMTVLLVLVIAGITVYQRIRQRQFLKRVERWGLP